MNTTTVIRWVTDNPWPAVGTAAALLAIAGIGLWAAVRRLRALDWPPGSVLVAGAGAVVCTAYTADTSWRFAESHLGMDRIEERIVMFAAGEIALLACAVMARANKTATATDATAGTAGIPGVLVWVITGVQIVPAFSESGFWGGLIRAVFGPVMSGLLWHLAMGLEIRTVRPEALSTGLPAIIGRELRERLLSRLGLAVRDRDAEQITRDRARATAVRLASRRRLGPWGRHRLGVAVTRSRAAIDGQQQHLLMRDLAGRRNAEALRTVPVPVPWVADVPDEAYPVRTPLGITGAQLRAMEPLAAVRQVQAAHPGVTPAELASLCTEYGVPVTETMARVATGAGNPPALRPTPAVPEIDAVPDADQQEPAQVHPEVHPDEHTRVPAGALAARQRRTQVHARLDSGPGPKPDVEQEHQRPAVEDVPGAVPDDEVHPVPAPLLDEARKIDARTRDEHGRPAGVRVLKAELGVGQSRAQHLRDLLNAEVPA
ncbi:hypothetical protein [Streptomyces albidoflavus]|uniref:hypothetical protein n=1 Tax=Streptomyces albidoflavus TaxID=1886 RepID=UPI0033D532C0